MIGRNFRILGAALACVFAAASATSALAVPKPKYPVDLPDDRHPAKGKHPPAKAAGKPHAVKAGTSKAKDTPRGDHSSGRAARSKTKLAGGEPPRRAEAKAASHKQAARRESSHKEASRKESGSRGGAYTVAHGDTLTSLARKFGVSQKELADANGVDRRHGLRAGMKLKLPHEGARSREDRAHEDRAEARAEEKPRGRKGAAAREASDSYTVARGDTLSGIARKLGVSQKALAEANDLNGRHGVRAGMRLYVPGEGRAVAREEEPRGRRGEPERANAGGSTYTVARGDTLSGVARRFHISQRELRDANDFAPGEPVERGMKLRLPGSARDAGRDAHASGAFTAPKTRVAAAKEPRRETRIIPAVAPVVSAPPPVREAQVAPPEPEAVTGRSIADAAVRPPPAPVANPPSAPLGLHAANDHVAVSPIHPPAVKGGYPSSDEVAALGRGRFIWPVRGDIVSRYGAVGHDLKNDGLNIASDLGASVRSAADGEVVYAGDSVPGFGNLVLVKHADGWVTAYGHLSKIDVKMRQKVTQGEEIGQVGQSGGVDRPQLHFEVRYAPNPHEKARPVDPSLLLP